MFGSWKKKENELDEAIDSVTGALFLHEPDTKEYATILSQLERLYALKTNNRNTRIKPDTIAIVAGNLAVAVIIVGYERVHVSTSKAFNFLKPLSN